MPTCRVDWPQAWRVIASRYPPINLFERLTPTPPSGTHSIALEQLTNPRVRDEIGDIALVPPDERVSGPGASTVMAAFTHLNPKGSRFSDGSFGVYYAAAALETAIAETVFHFEAFARDSADPPRSEDFRVLSGSWWPTSRMSRRCRTRSGTRSSIPTPMRRPRPTRSSSGQPGRMGSPIRASGMPAENASAPSARGPSEFPTRSAISSIDGTASGSIATSITRATNGFPSGNRSSCRVLSFMRLAKLLAR